MFAHSPCSSSLIGHSHSGIYQLDHEKQRMGPSNHFKWFEKKEFFHVSVKPEMMFVCGSKVIPNIGLGVGRAPTDSQRSLVLLMIFSWLQTNVCLCLYNCSMTLGADDWVCIVLLYIVKKKCLICKIFGLLGRFWKTPFLVLLNPFQLCLKKKKKKKSLLPFSHLQLLGLVSLWWASRDRLLDTNKSQPHLVRRGTGPQMFQGQAESCLPFARILVSLSARWLASSGAMWNATIELNSLNKAEPAAGVQGSGKRHAVFTQVLSTDPQSITVILPALHHTSDSSNHDMLLLWLGCMVALNTHCKHNQSSGCTIVASVADKSCLICDTPLIQ